MTPWNVNWYTSIPRSLNPQFKGPHGPPPTDSTRNIANILAACMFFNDNHLLLSFIQGRRRRTDTHFVAASSFDRSTRSCVHYCVRRWLYTPCPLPTIRLTDPPPSASTTTVKMPAVISGDILVTGANGYIAAWAVKTLLQQGFSVRGVVRSDSSSSTVRKLFANAGDRFQPTIVPDYTKVSALSRVLSRTNDAIRRSTHSTRS